MSYDFGDAFISSSVEESSGGFWDTLVNVGGTVVDFAATNLFTKENASYLLSQIQGSKPSAPTGGSSFFQQLSDNMNTLGTTLKNLPNILGDTSKITDFLTSPAGIIIMLSLVAVIVGIIVIF